VQAESERQTFLLAERQIDRALSMAKLEAFSAL
jgi:hypothetical protein